MKVLVTYMADNIGQVHKENAQEHINRLNKQFPESVWRTDDSPEMYVLDETDPEMNNPCILAKENVWVTRTPE